MTFRRAVATLIAVLWAPLTARAQRPIDRIEPVPQCAPCPPDARCFVRPCPPQFDGAQRTSTHVKAVMDGRVVRYEIEDRYVNRGSRPAEVDYVLPLPKGAAFDNLELSINGEMVAGETMRADRARAVYEEIVRKLRDPALVEWMGHDLVRTRIFPVQPGEEKRVIVRFTAIAQREGDAIRLDWPARAMAGARTDDDWFELRYGREFGGGTLGTAYSPTHSLNLPDRDRHRAWSDDVARTARATDAAHALTILVPLTTDGRASIGFVPYVASGEDGYALITITPPSRPAAARALRDVTFIVDVSGSMQGQKIEQARAAGRQFLASLDARDRFRLISFSSDVNEFAPGWTTATAANIREATRFVDDLRASGGTNIAGALDAAFRAPAARERFPLAILITDGAPTVGETRADVIAKTASTARGMTRLFTFGLGADVNAQLLEQLALQARGTATFIRPNESVERAVSVVTERLTAPVATNVTLSLDGGRLYALQPNETLDLFAGQDLVVLARFKGNARFATLRMDGNGWDGGVHYSQQVRLDTRDRENAFVARLWAVQRAGWLSAERRRTGGNPELDEELRAIGERYGIPTELTSYLVTEPNAVVANRQLRGDLGAAGSGGQRVTTADVPAAAPASVSATPDAMRFEAARASAAQRDAKSLSDVVVTSAASALQKDAGTHTFTLDKDGVWNDTRLSLKSRTVQVRAYGEAYFALLRELPELAEWFAVGDRVRIQGRAVVIELAPDKGERALDATAIAAIVRDWR